MRYLRGMFIGDSLVIGAVNTPGYVYSGGAPSGARLPFVREMASSGYTVHMMGPFDTGPWWWDERDHMAQSGWTTSGLLPNIAGYVNAYMPDFIMLWIGVVDCIPPISDHIGAATRLQQIVQLAHETRPECVIIVCTAVPISNASIVASDVDVQAYNAQLRAFVETERAANRPTYLCDVYPIVRVPDDQSDGLHLNDSGYLRVGQTLASLVQGLYPLV